MKKIVGILAALVLLCPWTSIMRAGIDFGSSRSGFVVHSGTFDLGTAGLESGMVRVVENGVLDEGSSNWSNMIFADTTQSPAEHVLMTLDGTYVVDGAGLDLTIGTNQLLRVSGGHVTPEVHVDGTALAPAVLQGYGTFASDIVINSGKQLSVQWLQPLAAHILGSGGNTALKLEEDLVFAPGKVMSPASTYTLTVDFNNHKIVLGGSITGTHVWNDANILLAADSALANNAAVTFAGSEGIAAYINGQNNRLSFGSNAYIDNNGLSVKLIDLVVSNMNSASFQGIGQWHVSNVLFDNGSDGKVQVDGIIEGRASGSFDIFGAEGDVTFAAAVTLQDNTYTQSTWKFEAGSLLHGNGLALDMSSSKITYAADFVLTDLTLVNCVPGSFHSAGGHNLNLANVTWLVEDASSSCGVRINGMPGTTGGATIVLPNNDNVGNIFDTNTVTFSGAHVEFLTDVTLTNNARWTFSGDSVVDGNGHFFDLSGGSLAFANNAVVTFKNMVLDTVTADSLVGGGGATIKLSNVTIKISNNVDWSTRTPVGNCLYVDGPVTIVTGDYIFTAPHNSVVDGVTLLFDTLGARDKNNVTGFSFINSGRCMIVDKPVDGNIAIETPGVNYLNRNEYLNAEDRALSFVGTEELVSYEYNGLGRSLVFPSLTQDAVLTIDADVTVTTKNILLDGLVPDDHIDNSGALIFGDQTTIRLEKDIRLFSILQFGSASTVDQTMTLDLNRFTIAMDEGGSIALASDEPVGEARGNTLRICNGRITNLSNFGIAASSYARIILENVELELADDSAYGSAALDIEGRCSITGKAGSIFEFTSLDSLTIKKGALLTIGDGITYSHNNANTNNFIFEDITSQLALVGGNFSCKEASGGDPLVLCVGTLIVDHLVTIDVNSIGMVWSDGVAPLSVEILPGALITVAGSGTLAYQAIIA